MTNHEKTEGAMSVPLILLTLIVVFLVAILLVLTQNAQQQRIPVQDQLAQSSATTQAEAYTPIFENRWDQVLVPSEFPRALFPTSPTDVEEASYYRREYTGDERFHFMLHVDEEREGHLERVRSVLSEGGFTFTHESGSDIFRATRENQVLTYSIFEEDEGVRVEIIFEVERE